MTNTGIAVIASQDLHPFIISIGMALVTSYTALALAGRITAAQGRVRKFLWLLGGAIATGIGIWSLHFISMLAYKLPNSVTYELSTVLASMAIAIVASGAVLFLVSRQHIEQRLTAETATTEALLISEARFRSLVQNASDIIQVIAADGTINYTSPSIKRILDYEPEERLGKKAFELVHPEDLLAAEHLLQEALRCPATDIKSELRLRHANGGARDFEAIANNLLADASVAGIITTYRDITKHKQTESELQNALEQLTFHFENSPLAVIEWQRDFRVSRWSRESEALFGWQAQEVLGKHPSEWQFVFSEDLEAVSSVMARLIEGSEHRTVSLNRNYTKDGSILYCKWYNSALLDESGKLVSVLSLILNVTEQQQAESALKARAEELNYLLTVLAQTNVALEKRNQELDQFTYVVSHDLKAPLRAIANLSQWIEEDLKDNLTEDNQHQMNLLRGRVHRMEALINGLLQYSRVGRVETTKATVSVATLLAEVIDSLAPPETFTIEVEPNMPTLVTERLPLEQVFTNLISNAIKHHPRSDGKIKISVENRGSFYEFAVADDSTLR